jgi:hypothetical protein
MRSWISLAVLLMSVAALSVWIYHRPKPGESTTHAVSTLKPAQVKRARLEQASPPRTAQSPAAAQPQGTRVALERDGQTWRITSPFTARAETFQVERLLSVLEARSSVRYPATDLARFGLDRPQATLTVEDQSFAFGAINTTTREQYVMTGGAVYLVGIAFGAALPRSADALLARELLAPGEIPLRFDLPDFAVAFENGTWTVTPAVPDLSADERNEWVDAWRQASAMSVSRIDKPRSTQDIRIALKDGRTLHFGIVKREPELVLVRVDEGTQYLFVPDVARRLLSPPGSSSPERTSK